MHKVLAKKGITEGAANQLNTSVFRLAHHTLRENDVLPAAARAKSSGCLVVPSQLGDPVVHGLFPYDPFMRYLGEEITNPKNLAYSASTGHPPFIELLAEGIPEFGKKKYRIPPSNIFIEAGISGAVRSLMTVLINRSNGDEVIIPKLSYTMYLAEAELSEAKVRNVELDKRGVPDLNQLRDSINPHTKVIFITTVGNPLGVAISRDDLGTVMEIVNAKEREFNHPIYLFTDIIYEGYRRGEPIDPVEVAMERGRLGPTIVLYSISKLIAGPGLRAGMTLVHHNGQSFNDEVHAFLQAASIMLQPGLGAVATPTQIALLRLYNDFANTDKWLKFRNFADQRAVEVRRRVHTTYDALRAIDGLTFPEYYYGADGKLGYDGLNSFYILAGISPDLLPRHENGVSHARMMADYQIDHHAPAVVVAVPGDHFLADEYRGKGQEYFRIVALFDETRGAAIESIRRFVASLKK